MEMIFEIIFVLSLFLIAFSVNQIIRNNKVYLMRTAIINAEFELSKNTNYKHQFPTIYKSLSEYDTMMWKFWIPVKYDKWLSKDYLEQLKPYL